MIISASRRTDIPAFYSEWFINRIQEGYFISVNPFNPCQRKKISLLPEDVDAIVFWSKYPKPIEPYFSFLDNSGYHYYIQFTLNHYPELFEARMPPLVERIATFRRIGEKLGPGKLVWRYDPIIVSNITPPEYHLETFSRLANQLSGYTHRVSISFLDIYQRVETFLKKHPELKLTDIFNGEHKECFDKLVNGIADIAAKNKIPIYSCAEVGLAQSGIRQGSCIDVDLINQLFDLNLQVKRDRSQRPECRCVSSVDVGVYGTCQFACNYCYANRNEDAVNQNILRYNPKSSTLIG